MNPHQLKRLEGRLRNAAANAALGPDGRLSILWRIFDQNFDAAAGEVAAYLKEWVDDRESKELLFGVCDEELAQILASRGVDVRRFPTGDSLGSQRQKVFADRSLSEAISPTSIEQFCRSCTERIAAMPVDSTLELPFGSSIRFDGTFAMGDDIAVRWQPPTTLFERAVLRERGVCIASVRSKAIPLESFDGLAVTAAADQLLEYLNVLRAIGELSLSSRSFQHPDWVRSLRLQIIAAPHYPPRELTEESIQQRAALLARFGESMSGVSRENVAESLPSKWTKWFAEVAGSDKFKAEFAPIASACHWLGQSDLAESQANRLVSCCIGIEAIVGVADQNEGLSRAVADRTSYVLERTRSQRKNLSDQIAKLLKVRGRIVHGGAASLRGEAKGDAAFAESLLLRLISVEFHNLRTELLGLRTGKS